MKIFETLILRSKRAGSRYTSNTYPNKFCSRIGSYKISICRPYLSILCKQFIADIPFSQMFFKQASVLAARPAHTFLYRTSVNV